MSPRASNVAGRRLTEIRASVMRKVELGEVAQKFMALAEERGMQLGKDALELIYN